MMSYEDAHTSRPNSGTPVAEKAMLLQVGLEVIPVCGDDESGWTIDEGDHRPHTAKQFRYGSLEELFFALVNFTVMPPGPTQ